MRASVLGQAAAAVLLFSSGSFSEASAACSYRTTTPSGGIFSGYAEEAAVACIIATDQSCSRCRPGFQHICLGGGWVPLPSRCSKQLTTGVPQSPQQAEERPAPFQQMPAPAGGEPSNCIYYDRDGRRMDLSPEDLAWAEENGLIAKEICPEARRWKN